VMKERNYTKGECMIQMDTREDEKLIKYFELEPVERIALPAGDYYIPEKGILIERKSMMDFIGSYCSGHLQEQCENMELNFETYYLFISGNYNWFAVKDTPYKHITEKSIDKMMMHLLMSFPGLRILQFKSDKHLIEGVVEMQNYSGTARKKELIKREQNRDDIYLSILTCFKGMSVRRAKAVAEKYKNIHDLMDGLKVAESKETFGIKEINKKIYENMKEFFKENPKLYL